MLSIPFDRKVGKLTPPDVRPTITRIPNFLSPHWCVYWGRFCSGKDLCLSPPFLHKPIWSLDERDMDRHCSWPPNRGLSLEWPRWIGGDALRQAGCGDKLAKFFVCIIEWVTNEVGHKSALVFGALCLGANSQQSLTWRISSSLLRMPVVGNYLFYLFNERNWNFDCIWFNKFSFK